MVSFKATSWSSSIDKLPKLLCYIIPASRDTSMFKVTDKKPIPESVLKIFRADGMKRERFSWSAFKSFRYKSPLINLHVEIKAVICLKRLNNVRRSVKHTPVASTLFTKGQWRESCEKDNMTYPERDGGKGGGRKEGWWSGGEMERERERARQNGTLRGKQGGWSQRWK